MDFDRALSSQRRIPSLRAVWADESDPTCRDQHSAQNCRGDRRKLQCSVSPVRKLALRSTYEVMTALEIAQRLAYCSPEKTQELLDEADEIAAMIVELSRNLV